MYLLGIDSTSKKLSVAVSSNFNVAYEEIDDTDSRHIVNIIKFVDTALEKSAVSLNNIDVFGVNIGPGDFTGTRIGLSVVKTFSWLKDKKVYGINSLDVFAARMAFENRKIIEKCISENRDIILVPALDVRKNEIYFCLYQLIPGENDSIFKGASLRAIKAKINYFTGLENKADYIGWIELEYRGKKKVNYIKKISDYLLVKKDLLVDRFLQYYKNGLFSTIGSDIIKNDKSTDEKIRIKNPLTIVGGNASVSYQDEIKDLINSGSSIVLDSKSIFPAASYVNICAYFKSIMDIKPEKLLPIYVREFVPFNKRF